MSLISQHRLEHPANLPIVTGPVQRFARQLAGHGYIVAAPSSYHNFTSSEPLLYNVADTDKGNKWKAEKPLASYDEDAKLAIDVLFSLPKCNGRIGTTGMCLGGHLAYRCAMDPRVKATVCYFATDIHSSTLGTTSEAEAEPAKTSLERTAAGEIKGEIAMIFGKRDTHVPADGRDLIRKTLHESGTEFSFYEAAGAQHAFIRDELSKGRYDPAISGVCFAMLQELFERRLKLDLGEEEPRGEVENIC